MKGFTRSQVYIAGVVALSPKSVILVSYRERERADMYCIYHFCRRLFIVLGREYQEYQ